MICTGHEFIRLIKSRGMSRAGLVEVRMRGETVHLLLWTPAEKDNWEKLGVDARVNIKCIFKLLFGCAWTGFVWLILLKPDDVSCIW